VENKAVTRVGIGTVRSAALRARTRLSALSVPRRACEPSGAFLQFGRQFLEVAAPRRNYCSADTWTTPRDIDRHREGRRERSNARIEPASRLSADLSPERDLCHDRREITSRVRFKD
jgi:hypothetical protein